MQQGVTGEEGYGETAAFDVSLSTTAEVTAELDFELGVADDEDMDCLASRMSLIGLDAADDYELAAELFWLDSHAPLAPVTELPAPQVPELLSSAA